MLSTLPPGGRGGRSVFSAAGKVPPPSVQVVRHYVHPRSLSAGAEPLLLLGLHIGVRPPFAGPSCLTSWAMRPYFTTLSTWYGYSLFSMLVFQIMYSDVYTTPLLGLLQGRYSR